MRAYIPDYELRTPKSLSEALSILANDPGKWRAFAGGTDLMVLFESGKLEHKMFLNLAKIDDFKKIEVTSDWVSIGALSTYTQIQSNSVLGSEFSMLTQAASVTGAIAIQNRGTLGGNIVNASPAADSPPALLCYDTELEIISERGTRWIPYIQFHTGYKRTLLGQDELLKSIRLRRNTQGTFQYYRKVGTRKAQAISKVCIAALARVENNKVSDFRLAFGSVGETALRCFKVEKLIKNSGLSTKILSQATRMLSSDIAPIDDIRSTSAYRYKVAENLLEEVLCGIGFQS